MSDPVGRTHFRRCSFFFVVSFRINIISEGDCLMRCLDEITSYERYLIVHDGISVLLFGARDVIK